MVHHSWLKETLKILGVADNIRRILSQSMCSTTVLASNMDTLSKVSIKRGIY